MTANRETAAAARRPGLRRVLEGFARVREDIAQGVARAVIVAKAKSGLAARRSERPSNGG
jgi:hypothetical protein